MATCLVDYASVEILGFLVDQMNRHKGMCPTFLVTMCQESQVIITTSNFRVAETRDQIPKHTVFSSEQSQT